MNGDVMIGKINNSQMQDILEITSSKQSASAVPSSNVGADASLQVDFASFIDQAMQQTQQTGKSEVQHAREILLSGRLDSPENVRAAAEEIINFGI